MKEPPTSIPNSPGIYLFKKGGKTLYIGKAQNLNMRLASYFQKSNGDMRKIQMVREADALVWKESGSDIEALILEAEMIKKHCPPYNILMRDDKRYFYVGFTRSKSSEQTKYTLPKIFLTHQPYKKLSASSYQLSSKKLKAKSYKLKANFVGPFTDGAAIKYTLRILRRAFPYCTCKEIHKRPCQQSAIGNCLGICCVDPKRANQFYPERSELAKKYQKNIRMVKLVLGGRGKKLLDTLKKEMARASEKKEYEKAAIFRNQIFALENIFEHRTLLRRDENLHTEKGLRYTAALLRLVKPPHRIEAYDISNIQGKKAVGSMVVFTNGSPDKREYRHFNIRFPEKPNDVAMIQEIISRRLAHTEWPYPDVIVIDGGKGQRNAAESALRNFRITNPKLWVNSTHRPELVEGQKNSKPQIANNKSQITPKIIALAKKEEELYLPDGKIIKLKEEPQPLLHLLQFIRNEAHRVAITHHRKKREKIKKARSF